VRQMIAFQGASDERLTDLCLIHRGRLTSPAKIRSQAEGGKGIGRPMSI
jgi:hypothetical protein